MAYDYIRHAKLIEEQLNRVELNDAAERLANARLGGATSGEILMALRYTLVKLVESEPMPKAIKAEADLLIEEINKSGV